MTARTAPKRFPRNPAHPERICWGCDQFCPAADMRCGNGSDRTPHPAELFGPDWYDWQPPSATGSDALVVDDAAEADPSRNAPPAALPGADPAR